MGRRPDEARAAGEEAAAEGAAPEVEPEEKRAQGTASALNPAEIRIDDRELTVGQLAKRLAAGELDLAPALRGAARPWSDEARSRLVESMLVRIPIPALYLDATDDERWLVLDGRERLEAIRRFGVTKELRLRGLAYLPLDGAGWDDLTRQQRRRIEETAIAAHLVQPGTPASVRYDVLRRIDPEAPLRAAHEVRRALLYGPGLELVAALAASEAFVAATGGGLRDAAAAEECVLRFLAFHEVRLEAYEGDDLDAFLDARLEEISSVGAGDDERELAPAAFELAMRRAALALGDEAFRRPAAGGARPPLSRPLFEAWSVAFASLDEARAARLAERAALLRERARALLADPEFAQAITVATGTATAVRTRFARVRALLEEVLA